jgi:hypothetical protein
MYYCIIQEEMNLTLVIKVNKLKNNVSSSRINKEAVKVKVRLVTSREIMSWTAKRMN